jgi:hypothetical protein
MRHLILAALSALAALPITIAAPHPAPELYGLGITAAFGAGMFYSRSRSAERRTNDHLEQIRKQVTRLTDAIESLGADLSSLRVMFEGWKGRSDATAEAYDRRLATLEELFRELAA